ncbi:hypothetical protein BJ508DRAFT_333270 [Ascobolus immersus RN42]|uniref:Mso1 N-terminal domain-containing protein n=1 Tax=Ascobolus immersus RN42 TaxID=1160509 RepID=A0A3N4HQB3_ASCIM|nr:hypothetical protein BJ508DRAFT_333270 [Ascobolus immersus RN42]
MFSSLKARLPLFSPDSDGDTESDSHLARVLRTHYLETGRAPPYPDWLGPPPKEALAASNSTGSTSRLPQQQQGKYGASLRRGGGAAGGPGRVEQGSSVSLDDIWNNPKPAETTRPRFFQKDSAESSTTTSSVGSRVKERLWSRQGGSGGSSAGQGGSAGGAPKMSANMPWDGGDEYYQAPVVAQAPQQGGYQALPPRGQGGSGGARRGLPSNPRSGRGY